MPAHCTSCGELLEAPPCRCGAEGVAHHVAVPVSGLATPELCACCLAPAPQHFIQLPNARLGAGGIPICGDCHGTHAAFLRAMNLVTFGALAVCAAVLLVAYPPARQPSPLTPSVTFAYCATMAAALVIALIVGFGVIRRRPPYTRRGHVRNCRAARIQGDSVVLRNKAFAERCKR